MAKYEVNATEAYGEEYNRVVVKEGKIIIQAIDEVSVASGICDDDPVPFVEGWGRNFLRVGFKPVDK